MKSLSNKALVFGCLIGLRKEESKPATKYGGPRFSGVAPLYGGGQFSTDF